MNRLSLTLFAGKGEGFRFEAERSADCKILSWKRKQELLQIPWLVPAASFPLDDYYYSWNISYFNELTFQTRPGSRVSRRVSSNLFDRLMRETDSRSIEEFPVLSIQSRVPRRLQPRDYRAFITACGNIARSASTRVGSLWCAAGIHGIWSELVHASPTRCAYTIQFLLLPIQRALSTACG